MELFIVWYDEGNQVPVPYRDVYAAFGSAASTADDHGFRVSYGSAGDAYVHASPDPNGAVDSVMVVRPCGAPQLWDAIVALMRLGHGLCVWPGDAQAVASPGSVAHLPNAVTESAPLRVVRDGAALEHLVHRS